MDVKQFVQDVLYQVTKAVSDADDDNTSFLVNPSKGIDFDLAVSTVNGEAAEKGASGGLRVKVIGAELSKSTTTNTTQEVTSRIRFNVLVE